MIKRSQKNPILTRNDIPDILPNIIDVSSVFNPGAVKIGQTIHLMIRVQTRGRETVLMMAESIDGESFIIHPEVIEFEGLTRYENKIFHVYDPRLTRIGNLTYVTFAVDTVDGCFTGFAKTKDLKNFEFITLLTEIDSRNGVLFPEMIGNRYMCLLRPNKTQLEQGPVSGSEIWLYESSDMFKWNPVSLVMTGHHYFWDELIGSGPPPVKTEKGWLHIYHGIATHFASVNIYQAGVVLLDLDDPSKVIARSRNNFFEPREMYELTGQVPNVVFPSGMIVDEYDDKGFARLDSLVRIYYGAADTCIGLATTTIQNLINYCE